jgi:hypothetical protein
MTFFAVRGSAPKAACKDDEVVRKVSRSNH